MPWDKVGEQAPAGDVWPLSVQFGSGTWTGIVRWGLPDYCQAGRGGRAQVLTLPLTADSTVSGGTDCGAPAYPTISQAGAT